MMERKWISVMVLLMAVTVYATGQSKKTIREEGIASITVQEYFLEEGMDEPVVESIEKFNEDGELVEIKEYNKKGDIKRWERYVYDADGHLVEEVFLDEKGRITETEKNIYEDELRIEKQFYNSKGDLYKKKVYEYEYRR